MPKKKIIFLSALTFLVTSCADTWNSVKRGVTGEKRQSVDEFLIKKKDPLTLPPDFENLPMPGEKQSATEETLSFEKALTEISTTETNSSSTRSTEQSILQKIKRK